MKYQQSSQRGFTLIELIMAMVIISIAAVPLVTPLVQVSETTLLMDDLQTGAGLAQECADHIIGTRRDPSYGYDAVADGTLCDNVLADKPAAYAYTVNVDATVPCPGTNPCKQVDVTITKGALTAATLTLMLIDY